MNKTATNQKNSHSILSAGKGSPLIIAGPCSAETEEQLLQTALQLKALGQVHLFRAGIWKPRTRPNCFEGLGKPALAWLRQVKERTGLPVACEVANSRHVEEALAHEVDVLWIGARTTVNPFSVQEIADALQGTGACVLVKNPLNPDLGLWIGAIERLAKAGINDIGAIHRGFSTYKSHYRNAPKWNMALAFGKEMPHMPLLCDPSHIAGRPELLQELSQNALDLGMDGLMIETHINPDTALSDAQQQITPAALGQLLQSLKLGKKASFEGQELADLADEIDSLDRELLDLLSCRARVSGKIGSHQQSDQLRFLQTERWQLFLGNLLAKGHLAGLEENFIQSIFAQVHEYSLKVQESPASFKP